MRATLVGDLRPDELIIFWGDVPRDAQAELYMPAIQADDILAEAALRQGPQLLEKVDAHTIRCTVADATYVPLPAPMGARVAGLMTIRLPETVVEGEEFRVVVHQHARVLRRILGTFEVLIPISRSEVLLGGESDTLAVLKHIGRSIAPSDRWFPVFARYIDVVGRRVRGFGGNPGAIPPSAAGRPGGRPTGAEAICARYGLVFSALLALFVVALGLAASYGQNLVAAAFGVAAAVTLFLWQARCKPTSCRRMGHLAAGLALGAGLLGIGTLLGSVATATVAPVMGGAAVLAALTGLIAVRRCGPADDCCHAPDRGGM
jgi:hypothetical protein